MERESRLTSRVVERFKAGRLCEKLTEDPGVPQEGHRQIVEYDSHGRQKSLTGEFYVGGRLERRVTTRFESGQRASERTELFDEKGMHRSTTLFFVGGRRIEHRRIDIYEPPDKDLRRQIEQKYIPSGMLRGRTRKIVDRTFNDGLVVQMVVERGNRRGLLLEKVTQTFSPFTGELGVRVKEFFVPSRDKPGFVTRRVVRRETERFFGPVSGLPEERVVEFYDLGNDLTRRVTTRLNKNPQSNWAKQEVAETFGDSPSTTTVFYNAQGMFRRETQQFAPLPPGTPSPRKGAVDHLQLLPPGYTLEESEHFLVLKFGEEEVVAVFSAAGASCEEIEKAALEHQKGPE